MESLPLIQIIVIEYNIESLKQQLKLKSPALIWHRSVAHRMLLRKITPTNAEMIAEELAIGDTISRLPMEGDSIYLGHQAKIANHKVGLSSLICTEETIDV